MGRQTWHAILEEPADEFSLAFGSGFRKNPRCMGPRRRFADPEPRGRGNKPIPANDLHKNACLSGCELEFRRKTLNLSTKFGSLIDNEDGSGWRLNIED